MIVDKHICSRVSKSFGLFTVQLLFEFAFNIEFLVFCILCCSGVAQPLRFGVISILSSGRTVHMNSYYSLCGYFTLLELGLIFSPILLTVQSWVVCIFCC